MSDDILYDAVLSAGEVSPEGVEFLGNNARLITVPASNLTYEQFIKWIRSSDRIERCRELYSRGETILGPERSARYRVRVFVLMHKPGEPVSVSHESDLRFCFTAASGESSELAMQGALDAQDGEGGTNGRDQAV